MNNNTSLGFTLIEILVVVVIIAVLAAVAVPQYQRAVYKSRFRALMSIARGVNQGNEDFYLTNGHYAEDLSSLMITGSNEYPDGTSVQLSTNDKYSYVLVKRTGLNNNYVMYQSRSANYPSNIHCEAKKDDSKAAWLCGEALEGTKVAHGSLTKGYDTYILKGSESDGALAATYTNASNLTLANGDVCEATQEGACTNLTVEGSTCTGNGKDACSNSTYEGSTCEGNQTTACSHSSFTNSTCVASGAGACLGSDFEDSTCEGNIGGSGATTTSCGSGSTYTRSTCKNLSSNGYSCGRSTYTDGSKCYSNQYGGCGKSNFSGGSRCYGQSNTACDNSTFTGNSVCVANAYDSCKNGTYKDTSYCTGDFCPAGARTKDGGTWCRGSNKTQPSFVCEN